MAFSGYLMKLKGGTAENFPLEYIAVESYQITPNQRMEVKANRATDGVLHRSTVSHTATKIEFETPPCTNRIANAINGMFQAHYTSSLERKIVIEYYDPESDSYKEGTFYSPDVQYKISRIDIDTNTIYYDKLRIALIEY